MKDSIEYLSDPAEILKEKDRLVEFLYQELDQYGDSREAIGQSIDYAISDSPFAGGFLLVSRVGGAIAGVVVMNRTGMKDYIPENILVYIAVHKAFRGKGLGKALMSEAIRLAEGAIALHVEPDNPARFLYEHLDFKNKYLEMRFQSAS